MKEAKVLKVYNEDGFIEEYYHRASVAYSGDQYEILESKFPGCFASLDSVHVLKLYNENGILQTVTDHELRKKIIRILLTNNKGTQRQYRN